MVSMVRDGGPVRSRRRDHEPHLPQRDASKRRDRSTRRSSRSAGTSSDLRIWIDVVDPTDADLHHLQETLGLHELSIEDSSRWGQRPKVEFYDRYVFVVVHGVHLGEGDELVDSELHVFAGEAFYLLTIRREPLFDLQKTKARAGREHHLASEGIGFHLYVLLDEIVDGYLDVIERLEDLADDVEEEVFEEEAAEGLQERIFTLKRKTVRFRRAVAPMREVIDLLHEREDVVTGSSRRTTATCSTT